MAGEVIRDVLIRVRVEHGDAGAFDKAAEAARKATAATTAQGNAATQAADKQKKAVQSVEDALRRTQTLIKNVAEEYARMGKKSGAELDVLIAREKQLLAVIKQRDAAIKSARGPAPGPVAPKMGIGQSIEQAGSMLGKVAMPVAMMMIAPAVARQLSDTLAAANRAFFGDKSTGFQPDYFGMGSTNTLGGHSPVADLIGNLLNTGVGRMATDNPGGIMGTVAAPFARNFAARHQESRDAQILAAQPGQTPLELLAAEVSTRKQHLDLMQQLNERERSMMQSDLASYDERIRLNQQIIASEKARIDAAREQFGLLDAQQKQDFIQLAQQVATQGVGSLSKRELEMVQGNAAFTGILSEEAKKAADASGFAEVVKALNLDRELRKAESQLELNVEQRQEIVLNLQQSDAQNQKVLDALEDAQRRLAEEMMAEIQVRMARLGRDIVQGPNF